ncbi:MAG: class I SAM-dependent methyltransferase [Planctomycetota bacterium]
MTKHAPVPASAAGLNPDQSEAFADHLLDTVNKAGLSLMLSIGHRTGLFDTMATLGWSTSAEIAATAGLDERYVREWLGAMFTGRVVEYDPGAQAFYLPREHAAWLTRAAAPNNLAVTMQWTSVLGHVEDQIVERFRAGGGIHYGCFHRFHEVMADESEQTVVAALDDHILPLVPGLVDQLAAGIDVLDVGCGSGRALRHLAGRFPASRFTGYDLCEDAVDAARHTAKEHGLENLSFAVRDVSDLGEPDQCDLLTAFDIVHDQRDPAGVLDEMRKALRPTGTLLMQDIRASSFLENNRDHPVGTLLYTISTMHCMTVSLAQDGAGLGTCWGEELALEMLNDAGFKNVRVEKPEHDIQNNFYIAPGS